MMKKYFPVFVFFISFSFLANAQFWSEIHHTGVQEILQNYNNPGPEYGPNLLWGWNGPVDSTVIDNDLDRILKMGFRSVTIEAGYHMRHPYLSEGWFKLIHYAVQEAGKRDMKVWLIDEGKYPSGFAGGKFSSERPDLRMQGLLRGGRIKLSPGESVHRNLHASVVSAVAVNLKSGLAHEVDISGHRLDYTAPDHPVTLLLALHRFKTSVTRAANNPTGGKDTTNSLCDYLNPVATRQFIDFTHTKYFEEMAGEFGKTLLGFRGDEPDYGFIPWTPGITEIFREKKGYDISPWLASFFVKKPTSQMMKAKADYRDVWSQLFADNFFGVLGDWCAEHGVAYMVHLNHEDKLMQLVRSEGSFFRDMRDVQIPGVDAIWNQIWPGTVADFPKLASSAAHLYGKPLAMSESFAAYRTKPTVKTGKWVIDHQLARGINLFEIMYFGSSANGDGLPHGWMASDTFPDLMKYTRSMSYLLSQGIPAAGTAIYMPTSSMWLADTVANKSTWNISRILLEHQLDFDFIDQNALSGKLKIENGLLINLSGQAYNTILIPSVVTLKQEVVLQLKQFAESGGRVIFSGEKPAYLYGRSFMDSIPAGDFSWAETLPAEASAEKLVEVIGNRDVILYHKVSAIKYNHRHLKDGELYFFFNEDDKEQHDLVTLQGTGSVIQINMMEGTWEKLQAVSNGEKSIRVPLDLNPWGTTVFILENKH